MKKIFIASLAASIAMAGGFVSKHQSENVISVKEALKLNDDAKVVLEGKIKSHIKSDKYEFTDKMATLSLLRSTTKNGAM